MNTSTVLLLLLSLCAINAQFNCPAIPAGPVPDNVNKLRPSDIKVVLALGDSLTAGFGIDGKPGGVNEFRGASYSIGGDANATTMPNFIRAFNPDLQGYSLGEHVAEVCYGPLCPENQYHPAEDVLNAAQSGAMASDLVPHEMDYIMGEIKANPMINVEEDWKLMTLLVGANDLCASCYGGIWLNPDQYEKHLFTALENVRVNLPRTLVQIVEIFNISGAYELSLKNKTCANIHRLLFIECNCIFAPYAGVTRAKVDEYAQAYNEKARNLAAYYQAQNNPNFTVITQPYARDTIVKTLPIEFLSTLDCFHLSRLAHEAMAVGLWNSMLTPAANKKTALNLTDTPMCPTADSIIYTS